MIDTLILVMYMLMSLAGIASNNFILMFLCIFTGIMILFVEALHFLLELEDRTHFSGSSYNSAFHRDYK